MYYKPTEDTKIKLSVMVNGVEVPYIFSDKEPFNHKASQKHSGYCSILSDLNKSFVLLDRYYGKLNDTILDEVLWQQSILLIGKTFAQGEGRGVKLEVNNFTEENSLRKFIRKIIETRNTYVAHHGYTQMSHFMTVVVLSDPKVEKNILDVGSASVQQASE